MATYDNLQPSLALTELINLNGIFPSRDGGGGATEYLGEMRLFAGNFAPIGMAMASGQTLSISQNAALFSILGTQYGGNGTSSFQLPDLGGRLVISEGQGPGLSDYSVGEQDGSQFFNIYQNNLPFQSGGTSLPVENRQPDLTMHYMIQVYGVFPSQGGGGATSGLLGTVGLFAGNFSPGDFLNCDGQLLNINDYTALFDVIGTTYGGDGVNTFALPDLRGRALVGAGGSHAVGAEFGAESDAIGANNLPTNMGGNGDPIDNHSPSLAMNYMIALTGIFPSRNAITNQAGDPPYLGEIMSFAGTFAPSGYALCQGQLLSIQQNQALFSILGTTYGGNGTTTFALPDLRDKSAIGTDAGHTLGSTYGQDTISLSSADLPPLIINGDGADNALYGGDAADTINGQAGNDTIHGNGGDDALVGGAGNDILDGGLGADSMHGGAGNDTYFIDNVGDRAYEYTNSSVDDGGIDTVNSTISVTLGAYLENLNLLDNAVTGVGNALNNVITGTSGANNLKGMAGDDTLDGGGGADKMYGGAGNDTYIVDNAGDKVIEDTTTGVDDGGTDTVMSSVTFTLGNFIENLVLTGSANIDGTGNALANTLTGNSGDNKLNGGTGADTMAGGLGNDTYYVDTAGDVVIEAPGEGIDTVISSISYILGANVENLTLTGSINRSAYGNALDNVITGNIGDNNLKGYDGNDTLDGGAGADNMAGARGNDIYFVDNAGDVVVELVSQGTDTVNSTISYTLGANVENLTLLGTAAIDGTGNSLNNVITGNSGNNNLIGLDGNDVLNGGAGADTMTGGLGDDTYVLDNTGDVVIENAGEGIDTIQTSSSYILGANLENLVLTGTANRSGYGNAADNVITGNSGSNVLKGYAGHDTLNGGTGSDTLYGGLDADVFVFDTGSGSDTIADFSAVQGDTINVHAYTLGVANPAVLHQVGADTQIDFGLGNIITVTNALVADVTAHMVW